MGQTPARFGAFLAEALDTRGLSLRDVSDSTGIALTTLHRKLRAESPTFTLPELMRLAGLLGVRASELIASYEDAA